jgi:hypothetical protein
VATRSGAEGPVLVTIGDIRVTPTSVMVPQGTYPLRGTIWTVQDSSHAKRERPAYAIVLAVIFAVFCLIGLLFLFIKQTRYHGFISVTVVGAGLYHSVSLEPGPAMANWVEQQVSHARGLAAAA